MLSFFKNLFNKPLPKETYDIKYKFELPRTDSVCAEPELTKDEQIDEAIYQKLSKILKRYPPYEWIPWKESACDSMVKIFSHKMCGISLNNHKSEVFLWLDGVTPLTVKGWNRARHLRLEFFSIREKYKKEERQKAEAKLIDKFLEQE